MTLLRKLILAAGAAIGLGLALFAAPLKGEAAPPPAALTPAQQAQVQQLIRQYLLQHPEVVEDAMQTLEARRSWARYQKLVSDPRQFSVGPRNAKVGIVEFFDYRCPHCKDALAWTMDKTRRPDVRVTLIEFPILSPQSLEASRAALASMKQGKYLAFHKALMSSRSNFEPKDIDAMARSVGIDVDRMHRDMRDPAIMALLQQNQEAAAESKIDGTPGFAINGKFYYGFQPNELDKGLRDALAQANGRKV